MAATIQKAKGQTDNTIQRKVVKRMFQVFGQMAVVLAVLLLAAGRIDWLWAWVYVGTQTALLAVASVFLLRGGHSAVVAERSEVKEGTKRWDRIITLLLIIPGFGLYIVAGLDARFGWSAEVGLALRLVALVIGMLCYGALLWAMMSNRFFATTVRIQTERDHRVVSSGPYAYVRHPGYVAMIISSLAACLVFGSLWALVMLGVYAALMVVRTAFEDRTLQAELPGYAEYAQRVRYRLIPGLW